ncbi:MAG: leucine-rich repeat domain-containing protein [Oxalobacteraceae bacterium]|nr:MAG: leucine-rich repeat domain-containing protein [Oxalobacteraceae bacterium]
MLYLYDNQIELIENLNFAGLLQYLYLQNNSIKEIPRLNMPNLKKLFLDDNEISTIAGLQECYNLEELTLSRQRLISFTSLQFDENTMQTLSRGLQSLDLIVKRCAGVAHGNARRRS